jgi:serine/threonine-protein kinase
MIGQQVGRYRITAKIGEGGMGAVFEAVDEQIGKRVAIKVLHKEHAQNKQVAQRFINEAKAINVVDNPGVVQVSEFDVLPDGTAYIVMELLKGETLNARLKSQGGRMAVVDALRLGRQIASALAAAHEKGIIHRDLKPDNIMLVGDAAFPGGERTKLLDFGIAKLKQEYQAGDQVQTRAGVMMGTPLYMAPEQCRNAGDVDDKADVYSLGVMMYRMLAGRPPFQAPGTGELMAMHIYMQPPPLQEADPSLPDELVKLVHRMLAKNRTERPPMAEVARTLEQIGSKASAAYPALAPIGALPPAAAINEGATVLSDSPQVPRPQERQQAAKAAAVQTSAQPRRTGLVVGIGVVVGLLAVGGTILFRQRTPIQPPPVAVQDLAPPDQAKPAPKIIRWHIESEPSGAEIFQVDTNENLGKTPFRVEQPMKAGAVKLELRLQGYKPQQITLEGDKDAEPPPVKLEKEKRKGRKK